MDGLSFPQLYPLQQGVMKRSTNKLILFALLSLTCGATAALQNDAKSLALAVIGDSGDGSKAQYAVAKQLTAYRQKTPFDLILMLGDNVYGGGKPKYFKTE